VLAISTKPDPLEGPYFEETIYVTPPRLSPTERSAIERCALDAVRGLGLTQGPVHAEFRWNEQGVWPLEVAPRSIGGLCGPHVAICNVRDDDSIGLEELLLRHALNLPGSDSTREQTSSGGDDDSRAP